jgi:two-component system sensor histidine kinase CpxA
MRHLRGSLFTKILVWFLATTVITSTGVAITSALIFEGSERRPPPSFHRPQMMMERARQAWEAGGAPGLGEALAKFRNRDGVEIYFTDSVGKDLLSGKDLSAYLPPPNPGARAVLAHLFRASMAHPSEDGRYVLISIFPHRGGPFWFLRIQHLWVLGLAILLCYGFAYHLSSPVRKLRRAVDRFGRGDFSARAESKRGDELGALARAFDQMADRIQTLLTAERRLLQDISHELRSPLARLSVAVELARSDTDRRVTLDRIQREADRLNELIGELLEVTRAEGDPSSQHRERLRVDEVVSALVDDCRIEATAKDCSLRISRLDPTSMNANAELLRRAIENVVRNAIRYAPAQTAVEISLIQDDDHADVRVRDFGPGVPDSALSRIFDPFYRVDTARGRTSGGVGLGLSIARRAVELHGGKLSARNAGPGLEVSIELPLLRFEQTGTRMLSNVLTEL